MSGTRLRGDDQSGTRLGHADTAPIDREPTRPSDAAPTGGRGGPWRWLAVVLLSVVGVGLLMMLLVARFVSGFNPFDRATVDRTQPAVLVTLQDLSEYRAATGEFQVIVDAEETVDNLPRQIAGQRTLFVARGTVDAAIDFSTLGPDAVTVDDARQRVTIRLPGAELTRATVDPERSYVFSRERGLLDRLAGVFSDSPTDDSQLYQMAERRLANVAADSGLVDLAERNTEAMLRGLLSSLGFTEITITVG